MRKISMLILIFLFAMLYIPNICYATENYNYINKNFNASHINKILINIEVPDNRTRYISNPYIVERLYEIVETKVKGIGAKCDTLPQMEKNLNYMAGGNFKRFSQMNKDRASRILAEQIASYDGLITISILSYHPDSYRGPISWIHGQRVALQMVFTDLIYEAVIIDQFENRFKEDGLFSDANRENIANRILDVFFDNVAKKISGKI